MKPVSWITAALLAVAAPLAPLAPLAAQQRTFVVGVFGGGADHLADLQQSPPLWFMPGYSVGGDLGVELTRHAALFGDFTYTRNPVHGTTSFAGNDVNRFFYGAHMELRYPVFGTESFLLAGVGGVSVDQLGTDEFRPFNATAATIGGGLSYPIPGSRLAALGQVRGTTYHWKAAGFDRQMFDVTYSVGLRLKVTY